MRTQKIFGVGDYWVKKTFLFMESLFLCAKIDVFQDNHEGNIVDKIQSARGKYDGILINAGGYTHTSVVPSSSNTS